MKIYIRQIPTTIMNEIYFVHQPKNDFKRGDIIVFFNINLNGEVIAKKQVHEYGLDLKDIKPTMILPEQETRELISAFVDYARKQGLKFDDENKVEGKLEATERHLFDLRQLLKLK